MPRSEPFIKGKALQTVIELRGFQRGDELLCRCGNIHLFWGYSPYTSDIYIQKQQEIGDAPGELIRIWEVTGWKPAKKTAG